MHRLHYILEGSPVHCCNGGMDRSLRGYEDNLHVVDRSHLFEISLVVDQAHDAHKEFAVVRMRNVRTV